MANSAIIAINADLSRKAATKPLLGLSLRSGSLLLKLLLKSEVTHTIHVDSICSYDKEYPDLPINELTNFIYNCRQVLVPH